MTRGAEVGQTRNTGRSSGPHVHYEILVSGRPVNPRSFVELVNIVGSERRSPRTPPTGIARSLISDCDGGAAGRMARD